MESFEFRCERNRIEYKSQLTERFEETIVALLNYSEGGEVYIGNDDNDVERSVLQYIQ